MKYTIEEIRDFVEAESIYNSYIKRSKLNESGLIRFFSDALYKVALIREEYGLEDFPCDPPFDICVDRQQGVFDLEYESGKWHEFPFRYLSRSGGLDEELVRKEAKRDRLRFLEREIKKLKKYEEEYKNLINED